MLARRDTCLESPAATYPPRFIRGRPTCRDPPVAAMHSLSPLDFPHLKTKRIRNGPRLDLEGFLISGPSDFSEEKLRRILPSLDAPFFGGTRWNVLGSFGISDLCQMGERHRRCQHANSQNTALIPAVIKITQRRCKDKTI